MNPKGAAAIIATILLVMMTVAAAGVAYTWITKMQEDIQKGAEEKYDSDAILRDAKLSIPSMWKNDAYIDFSLKNTGSYTFEDLSRFTIYVDGVPVSGITYDPNTALAPGGITTVSLTAITFPVYPAAPTKTIKVVGDAGISVIYRCEITTTGQSYC